VKIFPASALLVHVIELDEAHRLFDMLESV
jgi:hypothetical protein